jgi:sigma-B regulation protein RsbU (phosphoserine phosphatase)
MFITVMLAIYDASQRTLNLASAGHNPLLYYDSVEGGVRSLNPAGMPLGMPAALEGSFESTLETETIPLSTGDMLFMYTDGVTEAKDREGRQYGSQRLVASLRRQVTEGEDRSASGIQKALMAELEDYTGFEGLVDDISFIVARAVSNASPEGGSGPDRISAAPDKNDQ